MGIDLRGAVRAETRRAPSRALLWSILLSVLVVVAAGAAGTTHLTGPRWTVKLNLPGGRGRTGRPPRAIPRHPRATPVGGLPSWVLWVVVGIVAVGVVVLLWRWLSRRPSREPLERRPLEATLKPEIRTTPAPEPDAPVVRSGIELALQALGEEREPADAVVRAWLGLQQTAEESGIVRGPSETPTEFTSRILSRVVTDDRAIRTLLRLYLRTRFGDHPVTADDVSAVRAALEELVRTWTPPGSPAVTGAR